MEIIGNRDANFLKKIIMFVAFLFIVSCDEKTSYYLQINLENATDS